SHPVQRAFDQLRSRQQDRSHHAGDLHPWPGRPSDGDRLQIRLSHQRHHLCPQSRVVSSPGAVGALAPRGHTTGSNLITPTRAAGARHLGGRRGRRAQTLLVAPLTAALALGLFTAGTSAAATPHRLHLFNTGIGSWDWPSYGHDAQHTFHGRTTLNQTRARRLRVAWTFPTADAVTAAPTVVGGTVYVGSWDGYFYAIALDTGQLRWKFQLDSQPAVKPVPGQSPRDVTSDGGLVTSSAWFEPAAGLQPDLVIFAGGYTLYALDAQSGALVWKHAYTGLPEQPADPAHD